MNPFQLIALSVLTVLFVLSIIENQQAARTPCGLFELEQCAFGVLLNPRWTLICTTQLWKEGFRNASILANQAGTTIYPKHLPVAAPKLV